MSDHDPLCSSQPGRHDPDDPTTISCECVVLRRAREEERQRINSMLVVDYVREQYERGAADKAAELQDYYGEQAQGHYNDGYKMGYAKGLIEGDSGGRKEGYRSGYAAGKDAVMTSSYAEAVAQGQRDALGKAVEAVEALLAREPWQQVEPIIAAIKAVGE